MAKITFIEPDGTSKTVEATDGRSLMDAAVKMELKVFRLNAEGPAHVRPVMVILKTTGLKKLAMPSMMS